MTLGVRRRAPSVEALHELHAAHVERVPYETLWLHLGEQWGIRTADSFRRIAHRGRGGYCFHLNGAFGELLSILGLPGHDGDRRRAQHARGAGGAGRSPAAGRR